MDLIDEIQRRLQNEKRDPATLFSVLKNEGVKMFMTNTANEEQIITCCVSLISMFQQLEKQKNEKS